MALLYPDRPRGQAPPPKTTDGQRGNGILIWSNISGKKVDQETIDKLKDGESVNQGDCNVSEEFSPASDNIENLT